MIANCIKYIDNLILDIDETMSFFKSLYKRKYFKRMTLWQRCKFLMLVYVFATSCTNQGKNGTKIDKPPVLSQEHKSESKDKKDGKDSKGGIDEHYMNKVKEMSDMPELSDKQEDSEMISAVDSLLQSYYVNNGLDLCQFEQFLSNISTNNNTSTNTNNVMISAGEQNTCVLSLNNYKIYLCSIFKFNMYIILIYLNIIIIFLPS